MKKKLNNSALFQDTMKIDNSFDHHVHIGQWTDSYYSAQEIFSELKKLGKTGCIFMSTTSSAPLHFDDKKEIYELYEKVRKEINEAVQSAVSIGFNAKPYYWIVPLFHLNGISFDKVFEDQSGYCGLKIHPLSHNWDPCNPERNELLTEVFKFADSKNLPIILHTGESPKDSPCLYEKWFREFSNVKVTLAHSRNLKEVKYLFDTYPQLNGDTAFIPAKNLKYFLTHGYEKKLVYGSDFPICKKTSVSNPIDNHQINIAMHKGMNMD